VPFSLLETSLIGLQASSPFIPDPLENLRLVISDLRPAPGRFSESQFTNQKSQLPLPLFMF
jgi:hypothetical protein